MGRQLRRPYLKSDLPGGLTVIGHFRLMPLAAARIGSRDMRTLRLPGRCHETTHRPVFIGEHLQMVAVSDLTRGVDIDPDRHEGASITGDIAGCRCGGDHSPAKGLVPRNWGPRAA